MAIEWCGDDRGTGTVDRWVAVEPSVDGTEIFAEVAPFGFDSMWFVAWRRKMTLGEAVSSQITVQMSAEGVVATAADARATAERVIGCLQQIARDAPSMLWKLHQVAIPPSTKTVEERILRALNTEVVNGVGAQTQSR